MITINLLPEKQREFLRKERLFRIVLKQTALFSIVPVIFVGILTMLLFVRNIELRELERVTAQNQQFDMYKELVNYENDFRDINKKMSTIDKVTKGNLYWTEVFNILDDLSSSGVGLTRFSSTDYKVQMSGVASTRQQLLSFQDKLTKNSCFSNLNAPLSNLVSRENIEFIIDLDINPDCLRHKQ